MTCLRSSKRSLKPSKTKYPQGKHPNNLMPYKIIPRYGLRAVTQAGFWLCWKLAKHLACPDSGEDAVGHVFGEDVGAGVAELGFGERVDGDVFHSRDHAVKCWKGKLKTICWRSKERQFPYRFIACKANLISYTHALPPLRYERRPVTHGTFRVILPSLISCLARETWKPLVEVKFIG